jgi:hypothetical protein
MAIEKCTMRNFVILFVTKYEYYQGDIINEDVMGGEYSTHGRDAEIIQNFSR